MEVERNWLHPSHGDLYTPVTEDLLAFFEECHRVCGTWRVLAARTGFRLRQLRRMRNQSKTLCLSMRTMDRLIVATDLSNLDEWLWFSADDLVRLGIWRPTQYVEGQCRVVSGESTWYSRLELRQKAMLRRQQKKDHEREKKRKARIPDAATTIKFWQEWLGV